MDITPWRSHSSRGLQSVVSVAFVKSGSAINPPVAGCFWAWSAQPNGAARWPTNHGYGCPPSAVPPSLRITQRCALQPPSTAHARHLSCPTAAWLQATSYAAMNHLDAPCCHNTPGQVAIIHHHCRGSPNDMLAARAMLWWPVPLRSVHTQPATHHAMVPRGLAPCARASSAHTERGHTQPAYTSTQP
jgi:hypothetical protein